MRALVTVGNGGFSHLYPLVPLATDLQAGGHDVLVAAPDYLAREAARFGLPTVVLPAGGSPAAVGQSAPENSMARARQAVGRYLHEAVAHVPALRQAARSWRADVLVRESAAWAAWLVGELEELPVAVFDYAPTPRRILAMMLGDLFADARARVQLPPDPELTTPSRWLHLLAGPPGWFPPRALTNVSHLLQPPPVLHPDTPPPQWLAELTNSAPLVYVTLGTMYDRTPGILEVIFEAVSTEPIQVIATIGPGSDPACRATPRNVRLAPFLPQAVEHRLLARADAVVCHAGYGSILAAFRHGLPFVCLPLANADGPTRLSGLSAIGCAVVLPEATRSPDAVRVALRAILHDTTYREAARSAARSMHALPPFSEAARLVEQLARCRGPVLRHEAMDAAAARPVEPARRHSWEHE